MLVERSALTSHKGEYRTIFFIHSSPATRPVDQRRHICYHGTTRVQAGVAKTVRSTRYLNAVDIMEGSSATVSSRAYSVD